MGWYDGSNNRAGCGKLVVPNEPHPCIGCKQVPVTGSLCSNARVETEKIYTLADWADNVDFKQCIPVGALVDSGIYFFFLNSLPPIIMKGDYFQNSEPVFSKYDATKGAWRNTYLTFDGTDRRGVYRYLGTCFYGEKVHQEMEVS